MAKKRNSNLSILIIITFIVVIIVGAVGFYKGQIAWGSLRVNATVIEDTDSYVKRHKYKKEENGNNQKYYVVTVYQDMEIEYELDGETITQNTGYLEVGKSREKYIGTYNEDTSDSEYIDRYKYNVGDTVNVCINFKGDVFIGSDADHDVLYYKYIFMGFGGLLLILIISKIIKRNYSDKE
jgi:uncharacterized protein YxeA